MGQSSSPGVGVGGCSVPALRLVLPYWSRANTACSRWRAAAAAVPAAHRFRNARRDVEAPPSLGLLRVILGTTPSDSSSVPAKHLHRRRKISLLFLEEGITELHGLNAVGVFHSCREDDLCALLLRRRSRWGEDARGGGRRYVARCGCLFRRDANDRARAIPRDDAIWLPRSRAVLGDHRARLPLAMPRGILWRAAGRVRDLSLEPRAPLFPACATSLYRAAASRSRCDVDLEPVPPALVPLRVRATRHCAVCDGRQAAVAPDVRVGRELAEMPVGEERTESTHSRFHSEAEAAPRVAPARAGRGRETLEA